MRFLRRAREFVADLLDRIREPGWPRRIAIVVVLTLIMCIPYPLSITGEFEVISLKPLMVRNRVEGTLTEVLVKMGDHVKEGQVVARLLDVELKLEKAKVLAELADVEAYLRLTKNGYRKEEIQIARHRVDGLKADLAHKQAELNRETALFEANDIPKARLDAATNEHVQAKKNLDQAMQELRKLTAGFREEEIAQAAAKVEQLKGRLATTEQHLEWTEIKAPISGQVVTPDHELQKLVGSLLPRGTGVIEIIDPHDLVARVAVPETEFGDVKLGQTAELRAFQYPSITFEGTVDMVEQQVLQMNQFSAVVPTIIRVRDPKWQLLRVRTKGRAKLTLGSEKLGYVIYRRVLRSSFVKLWSWY